MKDERLHVVQMINALPFGGAERCVIDIANNADHEKFRHTIMIFKDVMDMKGELSWKNDNVVLVPKKFKGDLCFHRQIKKKLQELKADVVHTHLFIGDLWGRIAAKKLSIPVVTTEHNINTADGTIRNSIKKYMRGYSDVYVACSDAVKNYMRQTYKISEAQVIRCGVNLEKFSKIHLSPVVAPFKLLMVGRLTPQKGHEIAFRALSTIQCSWELTIVGDGELRKYLENLAIELKIDKKVKFVGTSYDIPGYLKKSQVFIMSSLWEGLGIAVEEAMAAGRVVVATNAGGITELINHSRNGLLCQLGEVEDLRDKLVWVFEHPNEAAVLAKNARKYAEVNFDVKKMVVEYEKIYSDLAYKRKLKYD